MYGSLFKLLAENARSSHEKKRTHTRRARESRNEEKDGWKTGRSEKRERKRSRRAPKKEKEKKKKKGKNTSNEETDCASWCTSIRVMSFPRFCNSQFDAFVSNFVHEFN